MRLLLGTLSFSLVALGHASAYAQDPAWPPPDAAAPPPTAPVAPPTPAAPVAPAAPATPPVAPAAVATPAAQPATTIPRPTNVDEYQRVRRRLKEELKTAERRDRKDEAERLERDLDTVNDWYREDVERTSTGGFVSGIVMTSVGGAAVLTGFGLLIAAVATDAAGTSERLTDNLQLSAEITLLSGVGLVGGGIPLMVWGGERVMADRNMGAAAPSVALKVAPGGAAIGGAF